MVHLSHLTLPPSTHTFFWGGSRGDGVLSPIRQGGGSTRSGAPLLTLLPSFFLFFLLLFLFLFLSPPPFFSHPFPLPPSLLNQYGTLTHLCHTGPRLTLTVTFDPDLNLNPYSHWSNIPSCNSS